MKTIKWMMVFLSSVFISCSQQDDFQADGDGNEITTQISVSVPDLFKSRAISDVYNDGATTYIGESGMPSIGNVDLQEHPLTFTVGIYIAKTPAGATEPAYTLVEKQSQDKVANDEAYFNFRLLKGQQYRIVAYADFNEKGKDDLQEITYTTELNNELSDAFFASQDFEAKSEVAVVLKRPFGKLRLIARDFSKFAAGEVFEFTKVKVNFKRQPMLATTTFNALDCVFNYDGSAQGDHSKEAVPVIYAKEHDGTVDYAAVFTMYLPANFGVPDPDDPYKREDPEDNNPIPQSWFYPLDVEVTYTNKQTNETTTINRKFDVDIPVKRNYLTTIDVDDFWTDNSSIKVSIDHRFDGFINYTPETVTVKTADELQAAISNICKEAPAGETKVGKIVLGKDIDARDRIGFNFNEGANNKIIKIYLDLNGHTITTDDAVNPGGNIGGLFHIEGVNCQLYIEDSNKDKVGGLEYVGEPDNGYPLVCCHNGGQATIYRGNFVTTSPAEAIYVYESEAHRATVQLWILKTIGIGKGSTEPKPTDPTTLATIETKVRGWTASATINGGWYQSAIDASTEDKLRVVVNAYNARKKFWDSYHNYWAKNGYPAWTDWGEYVNQPFGFVFVNGGSYVEFDPSRGDNIVGNIPNNWVDDDHTVLRETIDGKTVYTVVSNDSPEYY